MGFPEKRVPVGGQAVSKNVDLMLSRLERVKHCGTGWRADCPNGHSHAHRTLSITEADDGRILLHCFACRDVGGILRALGLEAADLFPKRIDDPSPEAQRAAHEAFKRSAWAAALGVLDRETAVVQAAAHTMLEASALAVADMERLALAASRIGQAREVLC